MTQKRSKALLNLNPMCTKKPVLFDVYLPKVDLETPPMFLETICIEVYEEHGEQLVTPMSSMLIDMTLKKHRRLLPTTHKYHLP